MDEPNLIMSIIGNNDTQTKGDNMTSITEERNKAFIDKFWAKLVRSDGQVMTYKELFERDVPIGKLISEQAYASKKTCLEYKKLSSPKITYEIKFKNDFTREVPKIIYDSMGLKECVS